MSKEKYPNIVLIYTDQQRFDTLGVNGNNVIRTPNLDKLSKEGVLFSRSYVTTPLCVPSRVALFTGRYNHTNLSDNNDKLMRDEEQDYINLLKSAGYYTGIAGKDHCFGSRLSPTFDFCKLANHLGFDNPENDDDRQINEFRKGKMFIPHSNDPFESGKNITARTFQWAGEFLEEAGDKPFFLWLSISDPHPPYMVCEPYASMYDNEEDIPPMKI